MNLKDRIVLIIDVSSVMFVSLYMDSYLGISFFSKEGVVVLVITVIIIGIIIDYIIVELESIAKSRQMSEVQRIEKEKKENAEIELDKHKKQIEEKSKIEIEKREKADRIKAERMAKRIKEFLMENPGKYFSEIKLRSNLVKTSSEDKIFHNALAMLPYSEGFRKYNEIIGEDSYGDDIVKVYYYYVSPEE